LGEKEYNDQRKEKGEYDFQSVGISKQISEFSKEITVEISGKVMHEIG